MKYSILHKLDNSVEPAACDMAEYFAGQFIEHGIKRKLILPNELERVKRCLGDGGLHVAHGTTSDNSYMEYGSASKKIFLNNEIDINTTNPIEQFKIAEGWFHEFEHALQYDTVCGASVPYAAFFFDKETSNKVMEGAASLRATMSMASYANETIGHPKDSLFAHCYYYNNSKRMIEYSHYWNSQSPSVFPSLKESGMTIKDFVRFMNVCASGCSRDEGMDMDKKLKIFRTSYDRVKRFKEGGPDEKIFLDEINNV